jgi:hypothetical protein
LCSCPSLRWLQRSSKISHFMKSNELKFWEIIVDIALHVSEKFQKDSRSYVSGVALQSCCDKSLHWENIKTNFWSGPNTTWEYLNEGVWRLGSPNTSSRPSYKILVCNHVLNTIQDIIRNTYIYVKPMYSIEFRIILETYIHMQGPSCSTLTLTLILETLRRHWVLPWKMADGISQITIEKLDKNNFQVWKLRIMNFLMGKGYWEFIIGDDRKPPLPENPTQQ